MTGGNGNEIAALKDALRKAEAEIAALKESLGEVRVTIDTIDVQPGWACFAPGKNPPDSDRLPGLLDRSLAAWLKEHPERRVRAALGIGPRLPDRTVTADCVQSRHGGSLAEHPLRYRQEGTQRRT